MGKTLDKLHIAGFYVSVRHIRGVVLDFDAATMKLEFNRFGGYCWDHPHAKAEESIQAFLRLFSVNIAAIQDSSWRPPRNVSPLSAITRISFAKVRAESQRWYSCGRKRCAGRTKSLR